MATAPGITEKYLEETLAREQTSLWADAWRRLRRNRLALVSTFILFLLVGVAIVSAFWTPFPIWRQSVGQTYDPPSLHHLLGTDQRGRDLFSRLLVGPT